ncbi:MAG TPA: hypothetical protein VIP77_04800 [Jiangellaceae bacterium]
MSDLKELRDHAQRLAESAHVDDCLLINRITKLIRPDVGEFLGYDVTLSCPSTAGHDSHDWVATNGLSYYCPGLCGGCMTEPERALWRQIATEIGAHLDRPDDKEQGALPL